MLTHGCGIMGTTSVDSGLTDNLSSNATWADNITSKWESGEPNHSGGSCGYIWKTLLALGMT